MNQLTAEQESQLMEIAISKGMDPEEALRKFYKTIERVKEYIESVKPVFQYIIERAKVLIEFYTATYKRYWHQQNVKFFKKKKSQRKNWSKWKKRNR